jgi:hypothetical protein
MRRYDLDATPASGYYPLRNGRRAQILARLMIVVYSSIIHSGVSLRGSPMANQPTGTQTGEQYLILRDNEGNFYRVPMSDLRKKYRKKDDDVGGTIPGDLQPAGCAVCCKF